MTKMKQSKIDKIIINKTDEIAVVVERIIDSPADEIVLNIPRFSRIAESIANFNLIKREAEILNKKIVIESVDDQVLEFANLVKIESVNPLFLEKKRRISDIISDKTKKQKDHEESTKTSITVNRLRDDQSFGQDETAESGNYKPRLMKFIKRS